MLRSVRVRLTAWYLLVFGSLLILFSAFIYAAISRSLYLRLDYNLSSSAETAASVLSSELQEDGGDARAGAREAVNEMKLPGTVLMMFWRGRVIASNVPESEQVLVPDDLFVDSGAAPSLATLTGPGKAQFRVAVVGVAAKGGTCYAIAAQALTGLEQQLASMRRMLYLGLLAALAIASVGGLLLAKKSLAPVVAMSEQAQRISARNLHDRLIVSNKSDELGTLAGVFNELLERLDQSFENMRRFMADASHELRTPLSIIRGEADLALAQDRPASEYREALAIVQDEARRLTRIVDDLLELARADAGQRPINKSEFYLNDLAEECCKSAHVLAASKGVLLSVEPSDDVVVDGDEDMIRRMVLNLLDNAIKFTAPGGSVVVKVGNTADDVKIVVADTGVGMPAESLPQIFGRFYRVDQARTRSEGGSGLGLAIARWVAEAHEGSIEVESQPGFGSTFTVTLPSNADHANGGVT
ncbi:MAG: heavy metal sensor histidine kinase [Blastocatellia bacterium]